ncbi:glycerol-3-phosphate acyltransferase [Thermus scotoductus]|uniref:glycerol-3-phosphate acyltransferase n=1 Tax=Thermus scotoductus TaxID=37636 RepID=UPI000F81147F|nr:glycerol-3-phosphate acyltransferase [Thermus scotoductus]
MAYVLLAYLLGSLVGGLLFFPEVRAKDLPGGSGVFRRKGPWAALWVVLWDLGKGALALLLVPSEWRVWAAAAVVAGHIPWRREKAFLKKITLVMGNKQQLIWDLPALDTFRLNAAIYDIPEGEFRKRVSELSEMLSLTNKLHQPVRKLSLGERMKAELLAALLHRPEVLFLDEPTLGLDVNAQVAVREFIREYNRRYGATVLLTSHYMADIAALAERVLVIHQGRLLYDGPLAGLLERFAPYREVGLTLAYPLPREAFLAFGEVRDLEGLKARLLVPRERLTERVAEILKSLPVEDLEVREPPLEEVIARVYKIAPSGLSETPALEEA